jgi:hypothetical protein
MKKWIVIAISLVLAVVCVDLCVTTLSGTLVWFVMQRHVRITVDGAPTDGYSDHLLRGSSDREHTHRIASVQLITVRHLNKRETFWIENADESTPIPQYCSAWVAPATPIFQVNVYNPPCFDVVREGEKAEEKPPTKCTLVFSGKEQIEFITQDGRKIRAVW